MIYKYWGTVDVDVRDMAAVGKDIYLPNEM